MFDIITIGSATKDVFLISKDFKLIKSNRFENGVGECFSHGAKIELGDIYFDTGGGATNSAVTFANLGLKTGVVSKVGNDIYGMEILHVLADKGVNTKHISCDKKHQTAYSTILITPGGDRTILVYRGASNEFKINDCSFSNIKTKWLYLTSLGGSLEMLKKIFTWAKRHKVKIAWNPGSKEIALGKDKLKNYIRQVDILNLNFEEARKLSGKKTIKDIYKVLSKYNENYVVVTDGSRGAYLLDGIMGYIYMANGLKLKVVNTTGAGDAFGSAFCSAMILKNDRDYALRLGILNSAKVITQMGAKNGLISRLPNKKDLNKVKISELYFEK